MNRDIVVIGASTGGVEALRTLVAGLPPDFPASVFVAIHSAADGPALLAPILRRAGDLPAEYPADGTAYARSHIYIAPPDRHLLLERDRIRVIRGPKENGHRPAIDPLFRSAAAHFGRRVIGVILTGALNDGTSGLDAIKQCGGLAVVQDPAGAIAPGMPASALKHVAVDGCVPLAHISAVLTKFANESLPDLSDSDSVPDNIRTEANIAAYEGKGRDDAERLGERAALTCPECGGALWELKDKTLLRYRCHLGHALTAEVLAAEQNEAFDQALTLGIRTLEESAALALRMSAQARVVGDDFAGQLLEDRAREATRRAAGLREMSLQVEDLRWNVETLRPKAL